MDGSKKDVGLDNVNACNNKVNLGDVYSGDGDSNNDVGIDDVGGVSTNGGDNADFSNGDSKFECGDDRDGGDGDDKDYGSVHDDGDADSNVANGANCGDGRNKVDCSEDAVDDDGNSNADGGGDTNDDGKGGDESDGESNDDADRHKIYDKDDNGCLNFVKNCFQNKQIVLENFSLPVSARWTKFL